ncbi:MAG: TIGR00266 family protein [Phycisphaerae bacterium]|nr:TIGR00266 family protein [Phycisphaerae bacterium]
MSDGNGWYYAEQGKPVGPMTLDELIARLPKVGGPDALVFGPDLSDWTAARRIARIASRLQTGGATLPTPPRSRRADEIDYEIVGEEMQYVEMTLDPGEMVIAESGAMFYQSAGIRMQTVFGDPNKDAGFLDKLVAAGRRVLTGESLFMTTFEAAGSQRERIAFAAPYPGKIVPMHLDQLGGELICQKDSFLCAARGVEISIAFQKRIGVALFGGEGFIMQRLVGDGVALIHAGGTLMHRELAAGETIKVDTGCLVALQPSVEYDIQLVGGIKNTLFGGEGLFIATLTGPGRVWLQSLPFSRLAGRVLANAVGRRKDDQGSLLGGLALGGLLGGDD